MYSRIEVEKKNSNSEVDKENREGLVIISFTL